MGLLPIDLSQKIALKRDSQSSKSSSDDPFQAIFHFFIDFSRGKSTIFLGYSHSRGVSHHFQPSLSSLPIGISHMSLRPTYNLPWTPLIRVSSAHIRASVTEEGLSLTSIFISPGLGFSLKNRGSGAVFRF